MKKFMFYLMVVSTFVASIMMIVVLAMGNSSLPVLTIGLRGVLIASGIALVIKRFVSWVRRGELIVWYVMDAAAAVFNLIYLSVFFPVEVRFQEFVITGTLVTPVLNLVLILLLLNTSSRYAVLENPGEEQPAVSDGHVQPVAKW